MWVKVVDLSWQALGHKFAKALVQHPIHRADRTQIPAPPPGNSGSTPSFACLLTSPKEPDLRWSVSNILRADSCGANAHEQRSARRTRFRHAWYPVPVVPMTRATPNARFHATEPIPTVGANVCARPLVLGIIVVGDSAAGSGGSPAAMLGRHHRVVVFEYPLRRWASQQRS